MNPKLAQASELWKEWNGRINVISRKDIDNIFPHHVLHSLCLVEYMKKNGLPAAKILDVGTGGGFPGIPMAIEMPQVQFTLCDSVGKKTLVASSIASGLGLSNVKVVNCRAEALDGTFDYIVSRAVASLEDFYPWVKGKFTKGILYLRGGENIEDEIMELCRKCNLSRSLVSISPVTDYLPCDCSLSEEDRDWYKGKFIVEIKVG